MTKREKRWRKPQQKWVEEAGSANQRVKERNRSNGLTWWRNNEKNGDGKSKYLFALRALPLNSGWVSVMAFLWKAMVRGTQEITPTAAQPALCRGICPRSHRSTVKPCSTPPPLSPPTRMQLLVHYGRSPRWYFHHTTSPTHPKTFLFLFMYF